jgi:hypothetical protein
MIHTCALLGCVWFVRLVKGMQCRYFFALFLQALDLFGGLSTTEKCLAVGGGPLHIIDKRSTHFDLVFIYQQII